MERLHKTLIKIPQYYLLFASALLFFHFCFFSVVLPGFELTILLPWFPKMSSMGYLPYSAFSESVFGCKGALQTKAWMFEAGLRRLLKRSENGHLILGPMGERNDSCIEEFAWKFDFINKDVEINDCERKWPLTCMCLKGPCFPTDLVSFHESHLH